MPAVKNLGRWAAALVASGAAVLALAWTGVLPGGFRLRSLVGAQGSARERTATFAREAAQVPAGAVVFLGSSTISAFPFARRYPGAPYLNRGVSGETTPDLQSRLDVSLPVARPAGVVLYTGANDLRGRGTDPRVIVTLAAAVLDRIDARFPGIAMTLVELMPERGEAPADLARLAALNGGLAELAKARSLGFVRTNRPPLTAAEGALSPAMTADGVHLNEAGYEVLARWIAEDGGAAVEKLRGR